MDEGRQTPRRRRIRTLWLLGLAVALGVIGAIAAVLVYRWQMPRVRGEIVRILSQELGARVELADLQVSPGWQVRVEGRGLVLHHARETPDVPPLISIDRFTISAPVLAVLSSPIRIDAVEIERLSIFIPKRRDADEREGEGGEGPTSKESDESAPAQGDAAGSRSPDASDQAEETEAPGASADEPAPRGPSPVVIGRVVVTDASLALQSSKPDRPPKSFLIHNVTLTDAAFDRPVPFEAHLTNPTPEGVIRTTGRFGPWEPGEPALTPVEGEYRFEQADLGTIKGIGGTLDSTGAFKGPLERIAVEGTTRTPDFSLDIGGAALPLETTFLALVDGSNGDTLLEDVRAVLGTTPLSAKGGIVHTPGRQGRTVSLKVGIANGRLEDVLRLAIDEPRPPMTGALTLDTTLELPPGEPRVADRLALDGSFIVDDLRFTSRGIQDKIDEFSRRGRGQPKDDEIENVASAMRGRFRLRNGRLTLSGVRFAVRGGLVQMDGTYVLRGGTLDFRGTVRLDARASQTMTGWKSWVLKPFDPLLAKDGAGTVLPITVKGTAKQPKFGVDVKKIF